MESLNNINIYCGIRKGFGMFLTGNDVKFVKSNLLS